MVIIAVTPITRKRDDRAQVAAADLAQRTHAAGAVQRHAEAEDQTADDQRAEFEPRAGIDRLGEIEFAEHFQQMHADNGNADRQQPGAKPARVVGIDRILDRTERAETPSPGHEAESGAKAKAKRQPHEIEWKIV